jgi:hypothetical protein
MSRDFIPAEALQVTYDLIDEMTSEIILNIDHRLQKFEALQVCSSPVPSTGLYLILVVHRCVRVVYASFVAEIRLTTVL